MSKNDLRYLEVKTADKIEILMNQYSDGTLKATPEELLEKAIEMLPVEKMKNDTLLSRIEGLSYSTDILFNNALELGHLDRKEIIKRAKIRPMSYYAYMTGSTVPAEYLSKRDDYVNDPATARIKLRDDIIALAKLIAELKAETKKG